MLIRFAMEFCEDCTQKSGFLQPLSMDNVSLTSDADNRHLCRCTHPCLRVVRTHLVTVSTSSVTRMTATCYADILIVSAYNMSTHNTYRQDYVS